MLAAVVYIVVLSGRHYSASASDSLDGSSDTKQRILSLQFAYRLGWTLSTLALVWGMCYLCYLIFRPTVLLLPCWLASCAGFLQVFNCCFTKHSVEAEAVRFLADTKQPTAATVVPSPAGPLQQPASSSTTISVAPAKTAA